MGSAFAKVNASPRNIGNSRGARAPTAPPGHPRAPGRVPALCLLHSSVRARADTQVYKALLPLAIERLLLLAANEEHSAGDWSRCLVDVNACGMLHARALARASLMLILCIN